MDAVENAIQVCDDLSDLIDLVEHLADKEHASWTRWMVYLFTVSKQRPDGSMVIPAEFVQRWRRQVATPYAQLSEAEKESDRNEVRQILPAIQERFKRYRSALNHIANQFCDRAPEDGETPYTPCTESGDCITEYCFPCYARAMLGVR